MSDKRLFISYSHFDKPFVDRLAGDLVRCGESVWVDRRELRIGDSLLRKLREAIDHAEYFLVVISKASVSSEWVQRELDVAMTIEVERGSVKVLPLIAEKVDLPSFLRGKVYADFSLDYVSAFNAVLLAIGCPIGDLAVIASIVYEDRDKLFEKLVTRGFETKKFLPPMKIAVEITSGYFSFLRGDKSSNGCGASVFQPHPLLDVIPERIVQRGPVVVALSNWRDQGWYEFGFPLDDPARKVLHIMGPALDVRKTINDDVLSNIDPSRSGVRSDLEGALQWWSVPHSAREVSTIEINQSQRRGGVA